MRKVRTIIAALLVAVFVLGTLNVSVAGQRDRLRQRVANLTLLTSKLEQRVAALEVKTILLNPDGIYTGSIRANKVYSFLCENGSPAAWRSDPSVNEGSLTRLSC